MSTSERFQTPEGSSPSAGRADTPTDRGSRLRPCCRRCRAAVLTKCPANRILRRSWLTSIFTVCLVNEIHAHWVCHLSASGDLDDSERLPKRCQAMMQVHDYTELCCKTWLAVMLVKMILSLCIHGPPSLSYWNSTLTTKSLIIEALPAALYLIWPGTFWVFFGEGGACKSACVQAEALMEHLCCAVVLLAISAAMWDYFEALCTGGWLAGSQCLASALLFKHSLEDHISPVHSWAGCSDPDPDNDNPEVNSNGFHMQDRLQVIICWITYVSTAALYVAIVWFGWQAAPPVEIGFRILDTICHAGICVLATVTLDHWYRQWRRRRESDQLRMVRQVTLLERSRAHVGNAFTLTLDDSSLSESSLEQTPTNAMNATISVGPLGI